MKSTVLGSFPGKPTVTEEIYSSRNGQTKIEWGIAQGDKKNMLRHLLQVNKKKGKRCRSLSDLISYVSKSDNTATVALGDLAFRSNKPIFVLL
jgi:hypothetical protein